MSAMIFSSILVTISTKTTAKKIRRESLDIAVTSLRCVVLYSEVRMKMKMDLFPAHRPGEISFRPAAKLNFFFFNLSRLTSICYSLPV